MSRLGPNITPGARVVPGIPIIDARHIVVPLKKPRKVPGTGIIPSPGTWQPKFEDVAAPGRELGQAVDWDTTLANAGDDPWTAAPGGSHVEGFRLIDASSVIPITMSDPNTGEVFHSVAGTRLSILNARSGVGSTVWVRFKPTAKRQAYMYVYFFHQDHTRARAFFSDLATAAHPGANPIIQDPSAEGVEYKRVSGQAA